MTTNQRILSCSLSPNTDADDVWTALHTILWPYTWKYGTAVQKVKTWFSKYFQSRHVYLFTSGRAAATFILRHFGIGVGDEVIIQAFTCAVVPNSVRFTGARPIYADIDSSLNIDPQDVIKKISKKTKAIIIQHTFGHPAQMTGLARIAKKHNILLIEDLAHAFGGTYKGAKLGTLGDAAFVSFGRDKVVSSVMGGAAIFNRSRNDKEMERSHKEYDALPLPSHGWIFQQLFHPIAFSLIIPVYSVYSLGKVLLYIFQKIHALSYPVSLIEKGGGKSTHYMEKYPNALAILLLNQLQKIEQYKKQRIAVSFYYTKKCPHSQKTKRSLDVASGVPWLRFPVLVKNQQSTLERAKSQSVLLGNWYHAVIDPTGSDMETLGYRNDCPAAEYYARHIINLPTRISLHSGKRVLDSIGSCDL